MSLVEPFAADVREIGKFAGVFGERQIDVLINNAGGVTQARVPALVGRAVDELADRGPPQ